MLENPRSPARPRRRQARQEGRARRDGHVPPRRPAGRRRGADLPAGARQELYATPTALERYPDIAEAAIDAGVDVEFVTEEVLNAMADTVTPQGFVAVCHQFPTAVKDIFAASRSSSRSSKRCATRATRARSSVPPMPRAPTPWSSPGRAVDLYNPKVVRSSTGSIFHLPVAVGAELDDVLDARAEPACRSSPPTSRARTCSRRAATACSRGPTAWLFGNEAHGLPDEQARARRPRGHRADLRAGRVDEPRDRGIRLPVRERVRAAHRRSTRIGNPPRRGAVTV